MDTDERLLAPQDEQAENRSPYAVFATIGLSLVIVILILVFWRSCSTETAAEGTSAGGVIESVEGLDTAQGVVSVWVRPESSIDEVLGRNGLSSVTVNDTGEGTYVIDIGDRDPEQVVRALADDPGLFDAGYLFEDE